MKIVIKRTYKDNCTLGDAKVLNDADYPLYEFKTLELPDKHNQRRISCIPTGTYKCTKNTWQAKFGNHFDLQGVPSRDGVKIHSGNYTNQILGCILPGVSHIDINNDGIMDVTSSKATLERLFSMLPSSFDLVVED